MSWENTVLTPVVFLTSYIALFNITRLENGKWALIHARTGAIGQFAI